MLEHLFGSKTRYNLLKLFFREPERRFFVREMTRELDTQINAIRREMRILTKIGLVQEVDEEALPDLPKGKRGPKKKYYRLNQGSMLYPELKALLAKEKIVGEHEFIEQIKQQGGDIQLLILTGVFTESEEAKTDILLVGKIKERNMDKLISQYEKDTGTQLRFTFMDEEEFFHRRNMMDRFLFSIFEQHVIKAVNELEI